MYRINIDKQSDFPIYQQIIQCVLEAVKDGSLKPGDKLPTEKELCFENDIARGTVRKAYDKLQKMCIRDSRKPGPGTPDTSICWNRRCLNLL